MPAPTAAPAPPIPHDAALPPAPDLPKLLCDAGTSPTPATFPEPTWFCVRDGGVRQGPFITLFPDDTIEITGSYKDGKLDGAWQRHFPGGALAEEGNYAAGQKDGKWRQLSPTGAVLGEYDMKAGSGTERRWYDEGPLYSERTLRGGVANGAAKILAPDGTILVTAKYWAGKLDGQHVVGYKPSLRVEETFGHGVRFGSRQIWQFWQLLIDEEYDNHGRLDGSFTIWRDKKVPRVQGRYDHGKRTGTWTWFDRGNNKEREGGFTDGKRDGTWTEWYENKVTFTGTYVDGKPDGDFTYSDRAGNQIGQFTMKDGTGTMQTYWPNHQVATKTRLYQGDMDGAYEELTPRKKRVVLGAYVGNRKHGWWREWTELGVLTLEEHWKRGKLDGAMKKYIDGKVAVDATYKDGKLDGPYTEFRGSKPALSGQWTADHKTGTWTEYDDAGAVTLTASYKDGVLDGPWHQLIGGAVIEGQMVGGRRSGEWKRTDKAGTVQTKVYKTP